MLFDILYALSVGECIGIMVLRIANYNQEHMPTITYSLFYNAPWRCLIAPPMISTIRPLYKREISPLTHLAKSLAQAGMISAARPMILPR